MVCEFVSYCFYVIKLSTVSESNCVLCVCFSECVASVHNDTGTATSTRAESSRSAAANDAHYGGTGNGRRVGSGVTGPAGKDDMRVSGVAANTSVPVVFNVTTGSLGLVRKGGWSCSVCTYFHSATVDNEWCVMCGTAKLASAAASVPVFASSSAAVAAAKRAREDTATASLLGGMGRGIGREGRETSSSTEQQQHMHINDAVFDPFKARFN